MLLVKCSAANVPEHEGGKQVLAKVQQMRKVVFRLHRVWDDRGYDGTPFLR